jgi:hypothetical protein
VKEGIIARDDRFGYVELATGRYIERRSSPSDFRRDAALREIVSDVRRFRWSVARVAVRSTAAPFRAVMARARQGILIDRGHAL